MMKGKLIRHTGELAQPLDSGMPSIRDIPEPYRLYSYSLDCNEPVHVHSAREKATCKFWLNPFAEDISIRGMLDGIPALRTAH